MFRRYSDEKWFALKIFVLYQLGYYNVGILECLPRNALENKVLIIKRFISLLWCPRY